MPAVWLLVVFGQAIVTTPGLAADTSAGVSNAPPASGPEKLKSEVRLVVATNAPGDGATNAAARAEKSFHWKFSWQGWDGLHIQAIQRTPWENPTPVLRLMGIDSNALPRMNLEQVKMTAQFGARVEGDGAAFVTTGDLTGFDDGIELRRLLVSVRGDCILLLPVSYMVELGYSSGQFSLDKAYLVFPDFRIIGDLQLGQFQTPMGLQLITSSRDISFMEPAAPLQAIAPGVEAGIQIGRPIFHERATWKFGLFAPGAGGIEYGNESQDYGSAMLRLTGLPIYDVDPADASRNRLLHLGLSANILYSTTSTVRYRSRPESYIAPFVVDTGDMDASSAVTFASEAAWVHDSFSAQGEFIFSNVNQNDGADLNLYGFYGQAGWYLTGETRPYNPRTGAFNRLVPRHNFNFGKDGGWGAWEVTCRYSFTDLNDRNVNGGRLDLLMAGVNWYLQPHVRWMFNYGMGHVSSAAQDGSMFIFQTRIGVDF